MKTALVLILAIFAAAPVQAQIFRPDAMRSATTGAILGAIIGHNSGDLRHNAWKGAAIGAGAGLLLGSVANADHGHRGSWSAAPTTSHYGYGRMGPRYSYCPRQHYVTRIPTVYRSHPGYWGTRNQGYAGSGFFWGGLAGAIIGHNSGSLHHNGWKGAAIGAGAGLLLGSLADAAERDTYYEQPVVVSQAPVVTSTPAQQAAPQNVTIINNYYGTASGTAMAQANSLFGR